MQKLRHKLPIVVTFTFIQTSKFCHLHWMAQCWQAVWRVIFVTSMQWCKLGRILHK